MSVLQSRPQNRSSSPSPAGSLRRHRHATVDHSPWLRNPSCHACSGGGGRWSESSISRFEPSGKNISTTNKVAPAEDDHVTDGRGGGNDDDDDWMCDDDSFGDEVGRDLSREEVRKSSWFRGFLARMGELRPDEISDPAFATLCPACKGDRGASLSYRGFRALLDHARCEKQKRVWLHRWLAEILEEETRNRCVVRSVEGDSLAKGKVMDKKREGLGGEDRKADDRMIVWPPMVVVLNTRLGKSEGSNKWLGMGNRDLMDCFKEYEPVKARSAYNINGHCGVSLLIFNSSVVGYHQAQRLHNQLIQKGRENYKQKPWKQSTDQKRLLYGYMVTKEEELNIFGTHSRDRQKLKYEMKPYQVVVGNPLKEMYGSNQKLSLLETQITIESEQKKNLDGKLRQRDLEIKATMRKLTEQSDKHNQEIESMIECCEKLLSKLKERELAREEMQKKICFTPQSTGDVQDDDGEYGKPDGYPLRS